MLQAASGLDAIRDRPLLTRGVFAVAVAVMINVVVVAAASALDVAPGFRALTYPPVVFLTVAGGAGATACYWLLDRLVEDVDRTFVRVATVVLVLSFVPDLALLAFDPAATVAGVVVLMVMHVVVAAAAVGLLVTDGVRVRSRDEQRAAT